MFLGTIVLKKQLKLYSKPAYVKSVAISSQAPSSQLLEVLGFRAFWAFGAAYRRGSSMVVSEIGVPSWGPHHKGILRCGVDFRGPLYPKP